MIYDLRMRRKQYSWIFNGCPEKLCIKDKLRLRIVKTEILFNVFSSYFFLFSIYFIRGRNIKSSKIFTLCVPLPLSSFTVFTVLNYNANVSRSDNFKSACTNGGRGICCTRFIFDRYRMIFPSGELLFLFTDEYKIASFDIWWQFVSRFYIFLLLAILELCNRNATRRARLSASDRFIVVSNRIFWLMNDTLKNVDDFTYKTKGFYNLNL